MIKEYQLITRTVEAVQYDATEDSIKEVIELAGEAFLDGTISVDANEWVIKKSEGEFEVMTDEEFQLNYRQK